MYEKITVVMAISKISARHVDNVVVITVEPPGSIRTPLKSVIRPVPGVFGIEGFHCSGCHGPRISGCHIQ